jgi:hypothetical protein
LNVIVPPVVASLIVVVDPAVSAVVVASGLPADPCAEVNVEEAATKGGVVVAEPPKTYTPWNEEFACATMLERTPSTWAAMSCLLIEEAVPVAPEVPRVIAVFSDVTIELMAESVVFICGSSELILLVYWSTLAEAASETTMFADAVGSSEG